MPSVAKFVKNIPKNQFIVSAIVVAIGSAAVWSAIYYKKHEVINEGFSNISALLKNKLEISHRQRNHITR